jgi:predicted nucleotidyltransferase
MMYGLREEDLRYITETIAAYPAVQRAVLFGSRAKGNWKIGSDIDLALVGKTVDWSVVSDIHMKLEEEGPMPYLVDVIDYGTINNSELKAHIDRVGIVLFERPARSGL